MSVRHCRSGRLSQSRSLVGWAIAAALVHPGAGDVRAQAFPSKPVRIVVGYGAGGGADVTSRLVGQRVAEVLGQPVIVENRTGATGTIGAERVATSPPDGHTLLMLVNGDTVVPALRAKLPYDLERDFAPVSQVTLGTYLLLVHPSVPARNVRDLVALARSQPGKLNYGSSGVGGATHLPTELFKLTAKIDIHHVPYKGGSAESVVATAAGEVDLCFASIPSALPLVRSGRLVPIAVSSARRAVLMPAVPTLDEAGLPGYEYVGWYGLIAPAAVPKDVLQRLNAAIVKVLGTPEMKVAFNKLGIEPHPSTPEEFGARISREIAQNARLAKTAGLKAE